eukprot:868937-Amphidinium_carterae.3
MASSEGVHSSWDEELEVSAQPSSVADVHDHVAFHHGADPLPSKRKRGRPKKAVQQATSGNPPAHIGSHTGAATVAATAASTSSSSTPARQLRVANIAPLHLQLAPQNRISTCVDGATLPSSICQHLKEVVAYVASSEDYNLEKIVLEADEMFLAPQAYHLASGIQQREQLGIWRDTHESLVCRLACALVFCSDMVRRQVEQVLVRHIPSDKLICAVEVGAYDETPMVVRVSDNCPESRGGDAETQHSVQLTELLKTVAPGTSKEKMVAKVLQVKQSHAFLVQVGAQHIMIVGDALLPLQAMQRNNSNVLLEILQRFSSFSPACKRFQCHSRCVVADKAKCNPKAETHLQDSRRLSSTTSLLQCDLHNIAACTRKTLDGLLGHHCSGLIRLALSLQVGSAM